VSAFIDALKRELALIRQDQEKDEGYPSLLVTFNATKYRNSECAWTMNTNNVWGRWRL